MNKTDVVCLPFSDEAAKSEDYLKYTVTTFLPLENKFFTKSRFRALFLNLICGYTHTGKIHQFSLSMPPPTMHLYV